MPEAASSNVLDVQFDKKVMPGVLASRLVEGWADLGAGVPGSFQLTFRDPKKLLLKTFGIKIGSEVVLTALENGQGKGKPLLTGEVTSLETDYDTTGTFTIVRGYDLGHRLLRQRRVVGYPNMTASDIVRKLAVQDKVPVGMIHRTKRVYKFVTQPNTTDWDFLSWLAEENKRILSINSAGKIQFVRANPASKAPAKSASPERKPHLLKAGDDVKRCRAAVTSADQVSKVEVRGWDVTSKRAVVGKATADANDRFSIGTTPKKASGAFGPATLVGVDTPYDEQSDVTNAASALADDVSSAFSEVEVIVRGRPGLRPGVPVTLDGVGEPFEGKYTVTGARHLFPSSGPYETWLTVSGRQWRSLFGLTSGGGTAVAPRMPGVANAIVTDVQDPLQQGRVKLNFPWLDKDYVSDWTRTVQFGGVRGGGIFSPDVEDEVLVAFDRGALDHPYVIGGLYNGVDSPDKSDVRHFDGISGRVNRHTLADRDGNRLDLLDQRTGARKRGVRLSTGDDKLTINLDRTGTSITVDSMGSVTITGSTSVSVEAGRDLTLSAGTNLTIKSGAALSIKSGTALSVRSLGGPVNVNSPLALSLGGAAISMRGAVSVTGAVSTVGAVSMTGVVSVKPTLAVTGLLTANGKPVI